MNKDENIKKIIECKDKVDKLIHMKYHKLAEEYNLTLEQFHLLIEMDELMLDVDEKLVAPTVGELAKNINNSQNTVSERITRLENKGLVERKRDSSDKRISRVYLTEEGRKLIKELDKEASSNFLHDALWNMEDEEINLFLNCFLKLTNKMEEMEK